MKNKFRIFLRMIILLGVLLSITGMGIQEVQAATCTWEGDNGPDWAVPDNWSCGHVPTTGDDVVIPDVTIDPVISTPIGVDVNTISISPGAVLTVNASDYSLTIYTTSNFTNDGEIVINGENPGLNGLAINSPAFANDGTVTINTGYLSLIRGGTHSGSFLGEPDTVLSFSDQWPTQTFTFSPESIVSIPIVMVNGTGNVVNFNGQFSPALISPETSQMQISGSAAVNLNTNDILLPAEVTILGTLNVLAASAVDIPTLEIIGGSLSNSNTLNITSGFDFLSANLSGPGDIIISNTASTVKFRGGTISEKTLRNDATANWTLGSMTLSSGAVFDNQGTFNANATTTMTGSTPAAFINNGNFIKNTAGTTTTMNVPFTNNGTVEVVGGSLVFQQGMENGDNVILDLGDGTLDPGETLTIDSGDSLIGSGTLSASLVNAGTVSPGASPGIITVEGDYTQESTGALEIELGGITIGTGYDQVDVNGTATLDGVLNVSLIDGYEPQAGNEFLILPYTSYTGEFVSLNLPAQYRWEVGYGVSGFTLTRLAGGSITGTVTCNSSHTVFVDLYVEEASPPPEVSSQINCNENYSFNDLPNGTYYIGAWIDLNESGSGPPDEGEPTAWYGEPTVVTINDGEIQENIDIIIEGGGYNIFLPLIVR